MILDEGEDQNAQGRKELTELSKRFRKLSAIPSFSRLDLFLEVQQSLSLAHLRAPSTATFAAISSSALQSSLLACSFGALLRLFQKQRLIKTVVCQFLLACSSICSDQLAFTSIPIYVHECGFIPYKKQPFPAEGWRRFSVQRLGGALLFCFVFLFWNKNAQFFNFFGFRFSQFVESTDPASLAAEERDEVLLPPGSAFRLVSSKSEGSLLHLTVEQIAAPYTNMADPV